MKTGAPTGHADGPLNPGWPQRLAVGHGHPGQRCSAGRSRSAGSGHEAVGTLLRNRVLSDRFSAYNICHWATPAVLGAPNSVISPLSPKRTGATG